LFRVSENQVLQSIVAEREESESSKKNGSNVARSRETRGEWERMLRVKPANTPKKERKKNKE